MDKYYIPSFNRKEFNKIYIKSIVYFLCVFIVPLFLLIYYKLINKITNNQILFTVFNNYRFVTIPIIMIIFIYLYIKNRIKFIDMLKTSYYIDGTKIIKGKIKEEKEFKKKNRIGDILFASFSFQKKYSMRTYDSNITKLEYLINNNTNNNYVFNNFFTDNYERVEYDNVLLEGETADSYIYKYNEERIIISKLYTNDELYLNYDGYKIKDKDQIKGILSKLLLMIVCFLVIGSIDLLINYNLKYNDRIKKTTDSINYRLVDYGYNLFSDDKQILYYKKNDSEINIDLNKRGIVDSVKAGIYINGFLDISTANYIMIDLANCNEQEVGKFNISINKCIDNKCDNNIELKCDKYLFIFKENDGKYVIIN